MKDKEKNSWKTVDSEVKYDTPWIRVTEHNVINPAGKPGIYGVVTFKNLAIGVLPIDDEGNTWLVGQWRYPLEIYSWEIPEGGGPLGEDPVETAKRELKEETGLMASRYREIGRIHTSNSVCDESGYLFIATGLSQHDAEPEDSEDLQVKKIPFAEALRMVMEDEITDSLSQVAILKAKILMDRGEI
jgi:ADP-ribose pyrophosphatase